MGSIIGAAVYPHPPIIIPTVGKGEEADAIRTIEAAKKAAEDIAKLKPSVIILISPHAPLFEDHIYISASEKLKGSFARFGAGQTRMEFDNHLSLAKDIANLASKRGISAGGLSSSLLRRYSISGDLDHGALVPLYFVTKVYSGFKLVHTGISGLSLNQHYSFGKCILEAVEQSNERALILASGDLSHRLKEDGPYGFHPSGPKFDNLVVNAIRKADVMSLVDIDYELCEQTGECGLRSFVVMFGALDGYEVEPEVYSYEGPFGVGYAIATLRVGNKTGEREFQEKILNRNKEKISEIRKSEDPYTALARLSLETYVKEGRIISVPEGLPEEMMANKAGVFVSLKKLGRLRGCIGTISATRKNISEEIIHNAISAGTRDPRFDPVEEDELADIVYSVDVLKEPEPIKSIDELDVKRYGVIVRSGYRTGLLLPNLEGVDTPEQQVEIALQKAGIRRGENYTMERFEVIRHH